jgi:hypothetical protein
VQHMVAVKGRNGCEVGIGRWTNGGHVCGKRYNGELFKVSLAGWPVACLKL